MYLLLGELHDPVCGAVLLSLESRGHSVSNIGNPMCRPMRLAWQFDTLNSASQLTWEDGTHLSHEEIEGVLVRRPGCVPSDGWNSADLGYVQMETHAALLAWLWSLECPVVNRYPAFLWYRRHTPLLFWQLWLERCGLRTLPALISNVEQEARAFGAVLGNQTVYAPLTAAARYRLGCDNDWNKLAIMQTLGPVHLTLTSMDLRLACVVGSRVVWDGNTPPDAEVLEPAFTHFSALVGLTFVEIFTSSAVDGTRVAAVNPYPCLEDFGQAAQHEIVAELVRLLTANSVPCK